MRYSKLKKHIDICLNNLCVTIVRESVVGFTFFVFLRLLLTSCKFRA